MWKLEKRSRPKKKKKILQGRNRTARHPMKRNKPCIISLHEVFCEKGPPD